VSGDEGQVRFRWKDYTHGDRVKTMALPATEFLSRFLLHILPGGFVRIRHFALLANRGRTAKLARCRVLLASLPTETPAAPESVAALIRRLTGVAIEECPVCHAGRLRLVAVFHPGHLPGPALDTS
jgi:hypothetical protein